MSTTDFLGLYKVPENTIQQPGVPVNASFEALDAALAGNVAVTLADANTTLTRAQWMTSVLVLSGTLTSGRDVVFPAAFPSMRVTNSTAQTLTLKKAGQAGVALAAGASVRISSGAADVVDAGGGGGSGDVVGPASATADAVALFDGTTGKLLKNGSTIATIRSIPQNSQSAAYTAVLADAGGHILHPSADTTARTFTIPANSSVAYPIGTALTFVNENAAGVVTIAITTDTMRLAGAGTTGSRTLAANGIATALKITSTSWIISGTGLS